VQQISQPQAQQLQAKERVNLDSLVAENKELKT